jgi:hypothetical protein
MRNWKTWSLLLAGLLLCVGYLKRRDRRDGSPALAAGENSASVKTKVKREEISSSVPPVEIAELRQREEERGRKAEQINDRWRTPIAFYGRVVDAHDYPVADAEIEFQWNNLAGPSTASNRTDSRGDFSLTGKEGYVLAVKVAKFGYYTLQEHGQAFYYNRGDETHTPDPTNPVTFRLKKHGPIESLNVFERKFQLSSSGRPIELQLSTGQIVPEGSGDISFRFFRETNILSAARPIFSWSFSCTAVKGGITVATNAFDFRAPEAGAYIGADHVEMPRTRDDKWIGGLERHYFFRAPDGRYSRLALDLMAHNGSLRIKIFHNPSGSQNLEYRRE